MWDYLETPMVTRWVQSVYGTAVEDKDDSSNVVMTGG
jgi:hypothetical protein